MQDMTLELENNESLYVECRLQDGGVKTFYKLFIWREGDKNQLSISLMKGGNAQVDSAVMTAKVNREVEFESEGYKWTGTI